MSDITPLLLDAKREYTQRLQEIVEPQISTTFMELFDKSGYDYYEFQQALRQVPYWNSTIVNTKTQYLMNQYPWFDNLVAAVIVTYVKVLSAIRLGDKPNVKLQLPKTEDFVHELYKQVARIVYYDPETIESHETMMTAVGDGIENSIRRLIPYDAILESYLAPPDPTPTVVPQDSDSSSDSSDSSDSDSDDDNEDINIRMPQHTGGVEQSPPAATEVPQPFGDLDADDENDENDDGEDDDTPQGGDGFIAPTSYPSPPPQGHATMPSPPPGPQQMVPQAVAQTVTQPVQTTPPPQQLFGSPQIRTGF